MPVGTNKVYDENGKLIKETNRDLPYNFSIQDLINKMQKEYKIDILDIKQTKSVFRYVEKEKVKLPLYEVWCYNQKNDLKLICYIINGTTGETIYVGERFIEGKQGSLLDQYLNSKKTKFLALTANSRYANHFIVFCFAELPYDMVVFPSGYSGTLGQVQYIGKKMYVYLKLEMIIH
ncbi:hypothetical protein JJC04_07345 [Flavobacterium covae]|nr:hypothetical protein [Flavobacterium covae]QYS92304.1 hypothetical protein JJC04_07345 [Flavobacterium covae]